MSLYPLIHATDTSGERVSVRIDRDGWRFAQTVDHERFKLLPVAERLDLRRQFEAQVELAKATPTAQTMANFRRAGL